MVSAREAFLNAPAKRASRRSERERNSVAAHFLEADFWTAGGASLRCGSLFNGPMSGTPNRIGPMTSVLLVTRANLP